MAALSVRIVGIETSCDETAIAVVENGRRILGNAVASSLALHEPYGGVIPEIAARMHVETISNVLAEALQQARVSLHEIDAIGVTEGPGLPGALVIGLAFAKGLALCLNRPLVPVDHLAAHLYAGEMTDPGLTLPYVGLVVSGGHTLLCVAHPEGRFELLGETRDDAVGEAFDKVAKLLGLGYPGGPAIDRLSERGRATAVQFPRSRSKAPFDFSFSGLKTAVYHHIERLAAQGSPSAEPPAGSPGAAGGRPTLSPPHRGAPLAPLGTAASEGSESNHEILNPSTGAPDLPLSSIGGPSDSLDPAVQDPKLPGLADEQTADVAASFQEAAVDVLVAKTLRACQRTGLNRVVIGGGVASNRRLRARFAEEAADARLRVVFPPPALCVDNGAMVAGIAYPLLQRGRVASLALESNPNLRLA